MKAIDNYYTMAGSFEEVVTNVQTTGVELLKGRKTSLKNC